MSPQGMIGRRFWNQPTTPRIVSGRLGSQTDQSYRSAGSALAASS